jgi:hypothetical protein
LIELNRGLARLDLPAKLKPRCTSRRRRNASGKEGITGFVNSSCAGLTRASISSVKSLYEDRWIAGSSPAMTKAGGLASGGSHARVAQRPVFACKSAGNPGFYTRRLVQLVARVGRSETQESSAPDFASVNPGYAFPCPGRSAACSGALQTRDRHGQWRSQPATAPDQRCTTSLRSRCTASGTHDRGGRVRSLIHFSNSLSRSRGAFLRPGFATLLHSPRTRGGRSADRRSGARRNTRGACHSASRRA